MEKITGMEAAHEVPPKVLLIYEAVEKLIASGEDINSVKVSTITELAGIGKGTVSALRRKALQKESMPVWRKFKSKVINNNVFFVMFM